MNSIRLFRSNLKELRFRHKPKASVIVFTFLIVFISMTLVYEFYDTQLLLCYNEPTTTYIESNQEDTLSLHNLTNSYIVWSPSCRIPRINPYHKSIQKYLFKWKPVMCSDKEALTFVKFNSTSGRHSLIVNITVVNSYSCSNLICQYSVITRKYLKQRQSIADDNRYSLSKPVRFQKKVELPKKAEGIFVVCRSNRKKVYKTMHYMAVDKKPQSSTSKTKKKFSILLFGIDSISRMNSIRTLPKTREYLQKQGWIELEGYNKVGYNTFPNFMPLLTGLHEEQLKNICYSSPSDEVDDCPFIWKSFAKEGFLTAYIEDSPIMGTFNYAKYGFQNSPTDYYSRPFMQAASDLLPKKENGEVVYCIGQYPQIEYLFQFTTEFVQRFHNTSYFNLLWANSFSHSALNMPSIMDERVRTFLRSIEHHLDSTVVVFFSDHGMRFGDIRQTFVGWLEERMPFIYFHLPPSFKATYPRHYQNLLANRNKLTSPFDLYATLQHLLYGKVHRPILGCPTCESLFQPVAHNRTCEGAGIPAKWCTCSVAQKQSGSVSDLRVTAATRLAVTRINWFLREHEARLKRGHRCATLTLDKIMSVRDKMGGQQEFVILFQTKPGDAIFEITVPQNATKAIDVESISRINKYGRQSACIKSGPRLKLFCFCEKN